MATNGINRFGQLLQTWWGSLLVICAAVSAGALSATTWNRQQQLPAEVQFLRVLVRDTLGRRIDALEAAQDSTARHISVIKCVLVAELRQRSLPPQARNGFEACLIDPEAAMREFLRPSR